MAKHNNQPVSTVRQLKEVAGLFSCLLEHHVTRTTATTKWEGPKIPPEVWRQIVSFFQWTYDTTHSESQVRLYVNARLQTWAAWAYPQEAQTGMSAHELDTPEAAQQRSQFSDTDGWLYFGTVHHHCGAGAFQSGVDEANEKPQDGLHITVGGMNDKRYTLHERFYLNGIKLAHDMSWFWQVDEEILAEVPAWARKFLPANISDQIARGEMCEKARADETFPEQWKANLIAKKVEVPVPYQGGLGYHPGVHGVAFRTGFQRKCPNMACDLAEARRQLGKLCDEMVMPEIEALEVMEDVLSNHTFLVNLIALMYRNDVSLDRFAEYVEENLIGEESVQEQIKDAIAEGNSQQNGIPDYEGGCGNLPE